VDAADTMFLQSESNKSSIPIILLGLGVVAVMKYYLTGSIMNSEFTQEGFDSDFETRHFWK